MPIATCLLPTACVPHSLFSSSAFSSSKILAMFVLSIFSVCIINLCLCDQQYFLTNSKPVEKNPPLEAFTCPNLWKIVGVSSHIIGDRVLWNWTCKPSEVVDRIGNFATKIEFEIITLFYSQRCNKVVWMPRLRFYHVWDSWNTCNSTRQQLQGNSWIQSNLCQAKAEVYSCQLYQSPYVWAYSKYQLWFQQGSCRCWSMIYVWVLNPPLQFYCVWCCSLLWY